MKTILILFLSFISLSATAQEILLEGRIVNAEDSLPIPFATIGIDKKAFGTVANEEGIFKFKVNENQKLTSDSCVISCVGYYPQKRSFNHLLKEFTTIYLTPRVTTMNEVIVRPASAYKNVELGKANHVGLASFDYYSAKEKTFDDKLGREHGSIIQLNSRKIYFLNQLNVYVAGTQFKKVIFRVCIYKVVNGKIIGDNILNQDIHLEVKENNFGWNTLDLKEYKILLYDLDEIAVTLQWIKGEPLNEKSKYFSIKASNSVTKSSVWRDKSRSDWSYNNGNKSIFLSARICDK